MGLLKTQQLLLAILGVQFMTGDEERALTGLVEDISFQRRLLVGADNLLLKMVALSMLGRDLHLYAQMLDVEGFPYDYAALQNILYPPRQDELSLRKALQSEFRASAYLFLEEFPRQDLFASSQTPRESAPWESKIVTFIGFKPNATLNTVFDQILGAERTFAGLDGPEIAAYWKERQQARNDDQSGAITSLIFDWPFNPVGNILTAVSAPNYDQYLARLHDLNGFLRLIELKRIVRRLHIPPNKIELYLQSQPSDLLNPYTSEPMQYDEDRAMFYFEGLSGTEDPHAWRTRVLVHDVVSRP